jgi:hypothetical protein
MTWQEIIEIAPAVAEIIQGAAEVEAPTWSDYVASKAAIACHVGFGAEDARLRNGEAFDTALAHLIASMPIGGEI